MKKSFSLVTLAAASLLAFPSFAGAHVQEIAPAQVQPSVISPADTFTFDIAGFNSASGVGYVLGSSLSTTFGTTQTFVGAGYNGQTYTITSSEAIGATTTVDTITISTPTNFLTSTTVNGTTITA
ncbi:MAG: hypothetical protein INR62_14270, partial [Rhodospirillales bacterium]|nr:hypothetical protein [Acetobacter sp.]